MKIKGQNLEPFLTKTNLAIPFILVFGSDNGLIHESAKKIVHHLLDKTKNQKAVISFTNKEIERTPSILIDSASSLSLFYEKQIIWLQEGKDTLTKNIKYLFETKTSLWPILIEASELSHRSSLRKFFEQNDECLTISCYSDEGEGLNSVITKQLNIHNINATKEALIYLRQCLSGDRMIIQQEISKLALYLYNENDQTRKVLSEKDARNCIKNTSLVSLDKLIFAIGSKSQTQTDALLTKSFEDGINPITIIRALQKHFIRLHFVKDQIDKGLNIQVALEKLTPKVFFKWKEAFKNQSYNWSKKQIQQTLLQLFKIEIYLKTTSFPKKELCRRLCFRITHKTKANSS